MSCEFLSGLTQLVLSQSDTVIAPSGTLPAGAIYLFLSARNRAGWTRASSGLLVNIPTNSQLTITLNQATNRGLGTDFIRYSLSANIRNNAASAVQIAEWENYLADTYTRRTLNPIVLSRAEHLALASSVATINDLPAGADLINGMHRLVIGASPSSYYKYSAYTANPWTKVDSPYTCQIIDPYGTAGAAADVGSIDSSYLILPPPYDPNQPDPVKGTPVKMVWRNNSTYHLPAGTEFNLKIGQSDRDRTDAFNGKIITAFKGYTDGLGNYDRLNADNTTTMLGIDGDRVWSVDASGIMVLQKPLPPSECAVWEISPYFSNSQFGGRLVAGEAIDIYIYPLATVGKNSYSLWQLTGDLILPSGDNLIPTPDLGASINIGTGSAIVEGYSFSNKSNRPVGGLVPNTANQKICIDGNGAISLRTAPLSVEAVLAIVGSQSGIAKIGQLSASIAITNGAALTLTYPCDNTGLGTIRADYRNLGGKISEFNPTHVRLWAKSGSNIYPALSNGSNLVPIVPSSTQTIIIDALGASIASPTNPIDPNFGLFDPPTASATALGSGTIASGTYQFFTAYDYDGTTVSAIEYDTANTIRATTLTFADLELLNKGWGRPILINADLRSIDRNDTFAWQHRPVAGGSIFYYDPDSMAVDDGITIFKPSYLTTQPGRWKIRKSTSINPVGIWNNTSTYSYLDQVVAPNDGSYLYINPAPSGGYPLTDTTYWQQTSFRGATGIAGASGSPHVGRGTYAGSATYNKYDEVNLNGTSSWWTNNTPGNTTPPSSDWQLIASKGDTGAAGSGVAATTSAGITDFAEAVDDRVAALLSAGANITLTYNDAGNILTISSTVTGGGLSPWQTKTSNYTAVSSDRLRVDCSAGNVTILLPANPTATFEMDLQRIDASSNSLIIDPNGKPFKNQTNKDGLFNNGNIGLSERISYPNSTIGYLPQHDRLTYQTHVASGGDPLFSNVVLLMPMTTTAGITDIKGKSSTNNGVTVSTALLDPFGQNAGVVSFPGGGSRIEVAQSADFAFGSGAMAIEWWLYPTAFPASGGGVWGLMDARPAPAGSDWTVNGNATGNPTFYDTVQGDTATGSLALNQWNYLCVSRSNIASEPHKIWINGVLALTATSRNNAITANGNLIIGDITGFASNLRITSAYRDGSIVPTAPFPTS
jgi:hypothetical protein